MISKEKFNELNSEKKKIYYLDYGLFGSCSVEELDFSKRRLCDICANYFPIPNEELEVYDYCNIQNDGDCDEDFVCYLKDCYETKEEAEFAKEFKNIKRTQILNLPTWKEFKKDESFRFSDKDGFVWNFYIYSRGLIVLLLLNGNSIYYFDNSKEGYVEGCKMVKKLFLGEKIDD